MTNAIRLVLFNLIARDKEAGFQIHFNPTSLNDSEEGEISATPANLEEELPSLSLVSGDEELVQLKAMRDDSLRRMLVRDSAAQAEEFAQFRAIDQAYQARIQALSQDGE